jgi:hypothetical protein
MLEDPTPEIWLERRIGDTLDGLMNLGAASTNNMAPIEFLHDSIREAKIETDNRLLRKHAPGMFFPAPELYAPPFKSRIRLNTIQTIAVEHGQHLATTTEKSMNKRKRGW